MCCVFKLDISESKKKLKSLLKREGCSQARTFAVSLLVKTGQVPTRKELAALLRRSQVAIGQWVELYRTKGLRGLLHLNYRGGHLAPSIPVEIQRHLKERLAQSEGFASYTLEHAS